MKNVQLPYLLLLLLLTTTLGWAQVRQRLPNPLNLPDYIEYAPSISADGRVLIFQSSRYGIFINSARKVPTINAEGNQMAVEDKLSVDFFGLFEARRHPSGEWMPPEQIESINHYDTELTPVMGGPSISYDGNTLFFFANYSRKGVGLGREDIYYSQRERTGWSEPINLGPTINTPGYEGFPSISPDGRHLYFVRENLTKKGETQQICYSLMMAEKSREGTWKRPIELPAPVNLDCEKAPRIMADGKTLVFSSIKKGGRGDFDLYMSTFQDDGTWSDPKPLDFINTKRSDQSVSISACGDLMYYVSDGDIYTTAVPEALRPFKMGTVQGYVTDSLTGKPIFSRLNVTETGTGKRYATLENSPTDGRYTALLPTNADYTITVNEPGHRTRAIAITRDLFATCKVVARDYKLLSIKSEAYANTSDITILKDEPVVAAVRPDTTRAAPATGTKPIDDEVIAAVNVTGPTVEKLTAEKAAEKRLAQLTVEDSLRVTRDALKLTRNPAAGQNGVGQAVPGPDAASDSATRQVATTVVPKAPTETLDRTKPADELLNVVVVVRDVETDSTLTDASPTLTDVATKTAYESVYSRVAKGFVVQLPPHTSLNIRATAAGYTVAEATVSDIRADKRLVLKLLKIKPSMLKIRVKDLAGGALLPNATVTIQSKTSGKSQTYDLKTGQTELTYTESDAVEMRATVPGYTLVSKSLVIETAAEGKIYEYEARLDRITFALKTSAVDGQTGKPITNAVFRLTAGQSTTTLTNDGQTGVAATPLPGAGTYELVCEAPGYTPKTQALQVDKETTEVIFKLGTLPRKTVSIPVAIVDQFTGEAIGASLNVTGAKLTGISPPLLNASEGDRVVLNATAAGYMPATRTFTVADSLTKPVLIRLGKMGYEFVFRTLSSASRKPVLDAAVMVLMADTKQRVPAETTYDKTTAVLGPQQEYIVVVKAVGFENYQGLFKPQEALKNNTLRRDLLLIPVAPAASPVAAMPQVIETKTFGTIEKGKAIVLTNLYFDQSSPVLRPESFTQLNELALLLTQNATIRIEIRGHTDNQGDFDLNVKLARDRCQSVIDYLSKKGIQPSRMQSVGRGPLDPVAPNTTEDNRKKNRRVEFVVL